MSIKKTDYPLLQKGVKRTRTTLILETKMLVIRKMEAGKKRANICSSLCLAPATVSTVMVNAEKNKAVGTEDYKIACIKCKLHYKF